MKKLIFKTAFITLGILLILAVSAFGIVSFVAPSVMMRFFDSIGFEGLSGDYAYQQYQISGDLDYLARSFEIAATWERDSKASDRFDEFYGEDGSARRDEFAKYCIRQNVLQKDEDIPETVNAFDYRYAVCAQASLVKYRLASTEEEKAEVADFAVSETGANLTPECAIVVLCTSDEVASDAPFCEMLLERVESERKFNQQNELYRTIIRFLEENSKEENSDE